MDEKQKIRVTVITGFLGAGKTTFINGVLRKFPDIRFALVENEFGEVSVDTRLIKGVDASRMFELRNGCICCTISNEYELVLQELVQQFPSVGHLLIETTGVADPAPVVHPFWANENVRQLYTLNGVVCLVDSINFLSSAVQEISLKQLASCDLAVISKTDRVTGKQRESVVARVRNVNPFCEISFAEKSDIGSFSPESLMVTPKFYVNLPKHRRLHADLQARTVTIPAGIEKERFTDWLSYTLDVYKNEIFRVKGVLTFRDEPYEYILQGVGGSWELSEGDLVWSKQENRIVFIGRLEKVHLEWLS